MRDLVKCSTCDGWRERLRACDTCGNADVQDFKDNDQNPEGNSRSLRRMLANKRRK
jgi:hypothetical protein